MSQLQKRCFFTSMGAHGLLLLVLLIGSAFFVPKSQPISHEAIRMIPSRLVDEALSGGGGNPDVPPPKQKEPLIEPKQEPPKPLEKPKETPKPKPKETPKEKPKPKVQPRVTLADLKLRDKPKPKPKKTEESDMTKELARARESLQSGLSKGTVVEVSGPGGEAYANYAAFVKKVYDDNWVLTDGMSDTGSTTRVKVVIDRDGDVVEAVIVRPSGNAALDQSVSRVLKNVKFVAKFPAGAREKTRSFTIDFNLRNKLGAG